MPPKKVASRKDKREPSKTCTGKDIKQLKDYADDNKLPRNFLAHMLEKDGFLEKFGLYPSLNECEFSFELGDWYAVHVTDEQNNKFFYDRNGTKQVGICYFKVQQRDDEYSIDPNTIRFDKPPELEGLRQCIINSKGKCGVPEKAEKQTVLTCPPPLVPKLVPKAQVVPPPQRVIPTPTDVNQNVMESLALGFPTEKEAASMVNVGPKNKISRDEAEKMDKATLIDWMAKNMYPADILTCLRTGALSAQERQKLEAVERDIPTGGGEQDVSMSQADLQAINLASTLPPEVAKKMYKKITKESFTKELRGLDSVAKKQGIAELCRRSGKNVETRQRAGRKPGTYVFELYEQGKLVGDDEINDLLDDCAAREANRLQSMLRSRWTGVMRQVASKSKKGKFPVFAEPVEQMQPTPGKMTPAELMNIVESAGDRRDGIIQVAEIVNLGYTFTKSERSGRKAGTTVTEYRDSDNNVVTSEEFEDILAESIAKLSPMGFGTKCKLMNKRARHPLKVSRVRSNFKCAVNNCKGSKNYKQCMKTTLRKIYRKKATVSFGKKKKKITKTRKSPKRSATLFKVGTVRKGMDKKRWIVKKTRTGVKRWVRFSKK